jgi:hypothetical protein
MTLQVYGPRAQEFVDLLAQFTGLRLVRTGEVVTVSRDTLLNPYESETLQDLVFDIVSGPAVVRIAAFSTTPGVGFSGDWFFPNPGLNYPRRSIFVSDVALAAGMSPILGRAIMGHYPAGIFRCGAAAWPTSGGGIRQLSRASHPHGSSDRERSDRPPYLDRRNTAMGAYVWEYQRPLLWPGPQVPVGDVCRRRVDAGDSANGHLANMTSSPSVSRRSRCPDVRVPT